jgi:hypothetical protein
VRRLILKDLIHSALVRDWSVWDDADNDLVFVSPDGESHYVIDSYPDADVVATDLHNLSPEHFPASWLPFEYRVEQGLAIAEKTLSELPGQLAKAALATTAAEAGAVGWTIYWNATEVVFEKVGKNASTATVQYSDIDIAKLRKALGLTPWFERY